MKKYLPLANDCEITVEGRIHGFIDEKIEAALEAGANRFSLGVQTFNTDIRRSMMRVDDRDTILARLEKLCAYDNSSVVMDLIYGFPGQTMDVWEDDVKTAASLPLDGIDCYQLNVFERSPLAKYVANGKLPPAADTAQKADMFAMSVEMLTNAHWRRLSNNHWGNGTRERNIYNALGKGASDCLAFGCGAGGRLHGHSFMMERKLDAWYAQLDAGKKPVGMLMKPTPHWHLLRTVSSEMESGAIDLTAIARKFDLPVDKLAAPVVNQWVEAGLLVPVGNGFVQTVAGQYWHVTLAQLLVNWLTQQLMPAEARAGHPVHPHSMITVRRAGHPKTAHPSLEGADPAELARKMRAAANNLSARNHAARSVSARDHAVLDNARFRACGSLCGKFVAEHPKSAFRNVVGVLTFLVCRLTVLERKIAARFDCYRAVRTRAGELAAVKAQRDDRVFGNRYIGRQSNVARKIIITAFKRAAVRRQRRPPVVVGMTFCCQCFTSSRFFCPNGAVVVDDNPDAITLSNNRSINYINYSI